MDYESKKSLHLPGTLLMFLLFTVVAAALSCIYIAILAILPSIYLSIFAAVAYGVIMFIVANFFRWHLKVTNKPLFVLFVLLGLLIAVYMKWAFWVAYMYFSYYADDFNVLNYFSPLMQETWFYITNPNLLLNNIKFLNEVGTWSYDGTQATGIPLLVIWAGEFLVMNATPLWDAFQNKNVFIYEANAWGKPSFVPMVYDAFEDYELDALSALRFDTITAKQSTLRPSERKTYRLAFMKVKDQYTGHVAIYQMKRARNGNLQEKIIKSPIMIGVEECKKLDQMLKEKMTPQPSVPAQPAPAPQSDANAATAQMDQSLGSQPASTPAEDQSNDQNLSQ